MWFLFRGDPEGKLTRNSTTKDEMGFTSFPEPPSFPSFIENQDEQTFVPS